MGIFSYMKNIVYEKYKYIKNIKKQFAVLASICLLFGT